MTSDKKLLWRHSAIASWLLVGVAIFIFYLGLTSYLASTQGFGHHEIITPTFIENLDQYTESNGYLYYHLRDRIVAWLPKGPLSQRSLSIVGGLLTLIGIGGAAYSLGGAKVALGSAFALCVHVGFLGYAAHDRFYACNQAAVALSTWFLILAIKHSSKRWWFAYAGAILGCVGTMLLSLAILVPHSALVLALSQRTLRHNLKLWLLAISPGLLFWGALILRDTSGYERFVYGPFLPAHLYQTFLCNGSSTGALPLRYVFAYEPWRLGNLQLEWWSPEYWHCPLLLGLMLASILLLGGVKSRPQRFLLGGSLAVLALMVGYSLGAKNLLCYANYSWLIPLYALICGDTIACRPRLAQLWLLALLLAPSPCWWCTAPWDNTINELIAQAPLRSGDVVIRLVYTDELSPRARLEDYQPWRSPDWPERWNYNLPTPQIMQCYLETYAASYIRMLQRYPQKEIKRLWLFCDHLEMGRDNYYVSNCEEALRLLQRQSEYPVLHWKNEYLQIYMWNFNKSGTINQIYPYDNLSPYHK